MCLYVFVALQVTRPKQLNDTTHKSKPHYASRFSFEEFLRSTWFSGFEKATTLFG